MTTATAPAPIPAPDCGMTDAEIIAALLTRLGPTAHIVALANEVRLKAEADDSVSTEDYDALAHQLELP